MKGVLHRPAPIIEQGNRRIVLNVNVGVFWRYLGPGAEVLLDAFQITHFSFGLE